MARPKKQSESPEKTGIDAKDKKRNRTKNKIMLAAYEIAFKKGLKAVTIRAIAAKAKTSVGLIYYHYKDVLQIFSTIHLRHYLQIFNYLDKHLPTSDDPLLRLMAASTINIQFASSRLVFQDISNMVPFSVIDKDSYYFSLIKQNFESIKERMGLDSGSAMLDTEIFTFIGAFETMKSAYYRSQLPLTPYELTRMVFLQTFTPMGLDAKEIETRIPEIEKICRNTKRGDIAIPLLSAVHDDAPGFNQITLHELGQPENLGLNL